MRFSLQDIKKTIQRRGGELAVSLHFLRPGELHREIERLIAYHESKLGQPQRNFSLDDARACIGDYRLAHCLLATLSHWYIWHARNWQEVTQEFRATNDLVELGSPMRLRLALYTYVNTHCRGFLDTTQRARLLEDFAGQYDINLSQLEYLLVLDKDEEMLMERSGETKPDAQDVVTVYNQWVFEAALFNTSEVRFVIDCRAFTEALHKREVAEGMKAVPGMGIGAVIKRLCYLARKLGVYYELAYDHTLQDGSTPAFLSLTLYGPQEVSGAPQQYGLRLARLCRMLLGYGVSQSGQTRKRVTFGTAVVEATATIHFLQRAYSFAMDAQLLKLLPPLVQTETSMRATDVELFDSSVEQTFAEAFMGLAENQGMDGWLLEREPEPLLLEQSIFIPDFALTRGQKRIYVEILGFWTPSYRERKVQKLQQLKGRGDLILAIPVEARDAFASIAHDFPVIYYDGQLSASDVLRVLRSDYDDFAERLELIDVSSVRGRIQIEGLIPEQACYALLHCYRRSELQEAGGRVVTDDISFLAGVGLYLRSFMERVKAQFLEWLAEQGSVSLSAATQRMSQLLAGRIIGDNGPLEIVLASWAEITIQRDSLFEGIVRLTSLDQQGNEEASPEEVSMTPEPGVSQKKGKRQVRERRVGVKKVVSQQEEIKQSDLWG